MNSVKPATSPNVAVLVDRLMMRLRAAMDRRDFGGLSTAHFRILDAVGEGATMTQLASALRVTKQGVGQLVTHLVGTGHLVEVADPTDRRRRVVVRTRLGDETSAAVDARIESVEDHWATLIGQSRYAQFRELLTELTLPAPDAKP